jgi:hypothetical protein
MSIYYGLAGFSDENGKLGRPVPTGRIVIPQELWLKNECIHWRFGTTPRTREVSRSMLNHFIRLKDGDSILRFAKEWGVLALSDNLYSGPEPGGRFYLPGRSSMKEGVEPVNAWQYYSKRAHSVLNVAAALKQGKLGDVGDWDEFAILFSETEWDRVQQRIEASMARHQFGLGLSVYPSEGAREEQLKSARDAIANEIGGWLECWKWKREKNVSDFALRWIDDQQRWDLQINYHGLLFPAIALQLALVLADAGSLFSCSGCGVPYVRPRQRKRPKSGWANYCDQCSTNGVAQRRAVETYREKRATATRLHSGGTSIAEIAEQLNTEVARVRGWLEKGGKDAMAKTRK